MRIPRGALTAFVALWAGTPRRDTGAGVGTGDDSPVPTPVLIVLGDAELLGVVVRVGLEVALAALAVDVLGVHGVLQHRVGDGVGVDVQRVRG